MNKNIKFFTFDKKSNFNWFCSGLVRYNSSKTFIPFFSEIFKVEKPINDGNIYVYDDNLNLFCIVTTLGGIINNKHNKKGIKINLNKLKISFSIYSSLIGSIYTEI